MTNSSKQFEDFDRQINDMQLWTSSGGLKHKLREMAIRYTSAREDGQEEMEFFLDTMVEAITKAHQTSLEEAVRQARIGEIEDLLNSYREHAYPDGTMIRKLESRLTSLKKETTQ